MSGIGQSRLELEMLIVGGLEFVLVNTKFTHQAMDNEWRIGMATAMRRQVYGFPILLESKQVRQIVHSFAPNRKMTQR